MQTNEKIDTSRNVKKGVLLTGIGLVTGAVFGGGIVWAASKIALDEYADAMEETEETIEGLSLEVEKLYNELALDRKNLLKESLELKELTEQNNKQAEELLAFRSKYSEELNKTNGVINKNLELEQEIVKLNKEIEEYRVSESNLIKKIESINKTSSKSSETDEAKQIAHSLKEGTIEMDEKIKDVDKKHRAVSKKIQRNK